MKKVPVVFAAFLFLASGCAYFQKPAPPDQATKPKTEVPNVVFYTFPDIPVPKELTLVREKSFIYETPSVKAGVLRLTGNIDIGSTRELFQGEHGQERLAFRQQLQV